MYSDVFNNDRYTQRRSEQHRLLGHTEHNLLMKNHLYHIVIRFL